VGDVVRLTVGGFWEIVINLRFRESGRSGYPIISHANRPSHRGIALVGFPADALRAAKTRGLSVRS